MKFIGLNSDFDYTRLANINGVRFTTRQIDVAACLIGRQKYKEIGRILSISPSTVDEHLKKIKAAICGSNVSNSTGLLEFFEHSDQYKYLRLHYVKLFIQYYFEEILAKMAKHITPKEKCLIKYHTGVKKHNFLNKSIRKHLGLAGIDFNIDSSDKLNNKLEQKVIYIIPNNIKKELEDNDDQTNSIIYIIQDVEKGKQNKEEISIEPSCLYHEEFFKLFNAIYEDFNVEPYSKELNDKKRMLENNFIDNGFSSKSSSLNKAFQHNVQLTQKSTSKQPSSFSITQGVKNKTIVGMLLLLSVIGILVLGTKKDTAKLTTVVKNSAKTFNLPRQLDYYTPRDGVTNAIWDILQRDSNKNTAILAGLHGLGGVGKTTLALNVVHFPKQSYEFKGWFSAETKELLKAEYLELGDDLHLFSKEMSDNKKVKEVIKWLNNKQNILLVYDNAPDLETLDDYLPNNGHIVITSRNYQLPGAIEVDVMTEVEALNLLNKLIPEQIKKAGTYNKESKELIKELGCLPLAISQAGAYISSNVISLSDYLKLYQTEKHHLLSEKTMPPGEQHEPVYVTWNVNIKRIKEYKYGTDALKLLDFISICYSENIPRQLLMQYLYAGTKAERPDLMHPDTLAEISFNKVLNLLRQHSLIKTSFNTISIHRLVQGWIKHNRNKADTTIILKRGLKTIKNSYPWHHKTSKEIEFAKYLVPHIESILTQASQIVPEVDLINLKLALGDIYLISGSYIKSKQVFEDSLAIGEKHFGKSHIMLSKSLYYLGWVSIDLGEYNDAKSFLEKALIIKEKHYDTNHFQLTSTLRQLGRVYIHLGDYTKAKSLLERALAIEEKHWGANHIETSYTLHHLAWVYHYLGNNDKARELAELALIIKEKYYNSSNHISAAYVKSQLGWIDLHEGNYIKAKELLESALEMEEKHYGNNHVNISYPLQHLGWTHFYLGDYVKAKQLLEKSLVIREKHYGLNHIQTAYVFTQLSWVYLYIGDYAKAKQLLDKAFISEKKRHGNNHLDKAFYLNGLGLFHYYLHDYDKSKDLIEKSSEVLIKLHGHEHIFTAMTLANLGNVNRMLGNFDESKKLLEQSLSFLQKLNSKDNIHTAKIMGNLGFLYGDLGNNAKKQEYLAKALVVFKQHLPSEHIHIKKTEEELKKTDGQIKANKGQNKELGYLIMVPI